ncbi:MAG: LemA family protein, partial [Sphingomonadaceae bacterium]
GQLRTIEDDVEKKRDALNADVERYNGLRASFPAVLLAGRLGFPMAACFAIDEAGLNAGVASGQAKAGHPAPAASSEAVRGTPDARPANRREGERNG